MKWGLQACLPPFPSSLFPHLQESHHRVEDDDKPNDPSLNPLFHGNGQGHGHEENQGRNIEQMPQKKDDWMHGTTTFQSVATKDESALFHFQRRETLRGGDLWGGELGEERKDEHRR